MRPRVPTPGSTIGRKLRDLSTSIAVAVSLLVLCESGLRAAFPVGIASTELKPARPKREMVYLPNDDYIVALRANLRTTFERDENNGGDTIPWETNSLSFRGEELKAYSDIRVMVYGDSNIQAKFSPNKQTFPSRLQQYLSKRFAPSHIEVVNSGVVGFGPDQSLIKLSKEADIYRPDLIVLHVFADNDFGDIVRNRLFELDGNGKLVRTKFKVEKDLAFVNAEKVAAEPSRWERFVSSLLIGQAAGRVAKRLNHSKKPQEITPADAVETLLAKTTEEYAVYRERRPKRFSHFDDHYDIDLAIHPNAESSIAKVKLMEAVLREARSVTAGKGIGFLVLIEPSAIDITEGQSISHKQLQKYPEWKRTNLSAFVDAICGRASIARVNLFEPFIGNKPDELYFRISDSHWNDLGQNLAAKVTAEYIAKNMPEILSAR